MNTPAILNQEIWRYARGFYTPEQQLLLDECVESSEEILALNGKSEEGQYSYFTEYEYATENLTIGMHRIDGFFEGSLFIQASYVNQAQEPVTDTYVFMDGSSAVQKFDGDPFDTQHEERVTTNMDPEEIVLLSELIKFVKQAEETKTYPRGTGSENAELALSFDSCRELIQDIARDVAGFSMNGGFLQELEWKSQRVGVSVYRLKHHGYRAGNRAVTLGMTITTHPEMFGSVRDSLAITLDEDRPGDQKVEVYHDSGEKEVTDEDLQMFQSMLEYLAYSADYNSWNKAAQTMPGSAR